MNCIVIGKERDGYRPTKDVSFDILSLVNQLYRLKSIYSEDSEYGKIYFLENQVPNLIKLGLNHLLRTVKAYKEAIQKNTVHESRASILEEGNNKVVDELFR